MNIASTPLGVERTKVLESFQENLQLRFKSVELLNLAFCHSSFANEASDKPQNNERLEFLGDSVLGLIVADSLFCRLPTKNEGELAKIKAFVVSEDSLARLAVSLGLPNLLLIGKGEELSGGRQKKAILADCLEAVIGAVYVDQGIAVCQAFVDRLFLPEIAAVLENRHQKDYKTLLQEFSQKQLRTYPKYLLVSRTGPDHAKIFSMEVQIGDRRWGPAQGLSKKEAEQAAALLAWQDLEPQP